MNELKYCCEKFRFRNIDLKNNQYPSIRIVKFNDPHLSALAKSEKGRNKIRLLRGWVFVLISQEYEVFDFSKMLFIQMDYCPFCGKDLYKFYKSDAYANEIQGITFDIK